MGFELDDAVYAASRRNLSLLGLDVTLLHGRYETALTRALVGDDDLVIVYVAPPWGDALDPSSGLDLCRTSPPVAEVFDLVRAIFAPHKVIVAVQLYESVVTGSVDDVSSRADWATSIVYDIDPPGRNHGLLLMTLGWAPSNRPTTGD